MTIYDDMQSVASDLFAEFGQGIIQYVRITPGNGPADNPGPSVETPFTLDATARGVKFKYVQNGLALATDEQITAAAHPALIADFAAETVMRGFVTIDGNRRKIIQSIAKPSAGTPAAFVLIVRK